MQRIRVRSQAAITVPNRYFLRDGNSVVVRGRRTCVGLVPDPCLWSSR
jgi:hypothetical protein